MLKDALNKDNFIVKSNYEQLKNHPNIALYITYKGEDNLRENLYKEMQTWLAHIKRKLMKTFQISWSNLVNHLWILEQ